MQVDLICWAKLVRRDVPSPVAPLIVFQGGQVLHPSPECMVSTGDSQEGLGCLDWSLQVPPIPSYPCDARPDLTKPPSILSGQGGGQTILPGLSPEYCFREPWRQAKQVHIFTLPLRV